MAAAHTGRLAAQGLVAPAVGPVNHSMGGAGTAIPLDATGAIHWNPASISGLKRSQVDLGFGFIVPSSTLSSRVDAGALAPGLPPVTLSGRTDGDTTAIPLPTVGLVYKPPESRWTFGLGVFSIGGLGADYPEDSGNPLLSAPPPAGVGGGEVFARLQLFQAAPTASFAITDNLSVGLAPTLTIADLSSDPFPFAAPDDANGDGFPSSPSATSSLPRYGGGFQLGVYYENPEGWHLGLGFKSKQWFETFKFNSEDELGRHRTVEAEFEYPMIITTGVAYSGLERWTFAVDVRFIDYDNARVLGESGFRSDGSIRGVGWDSVFLIGLGVQYQVLDPLSLRLGYSYNESPATDSDTFTNVASTAIYEHTIYFGGTYAFSEDVSASLAYFHSFENSIEGPFKTPAGSVAGTSVEIESRTDGFFASLTFKWGGESSEGE